MDKKPFYIGWEKKMPAFHKKGIFPLLLVVFLLLPVLAFLLVYTQKGFNDHQFELGQIRTFQGDYYAYPVPRLVVTADQVPEGYSPDMLLVGYGKFGAEGIMNKAAEQIGVPLNGRKIKVEGSLIYGDGKVLLELSPKQAGIIEIIEGKVEAMALSSKQREILTGEILDPKCYFGVMKPGEGKIHKSCAVRCISGGIPPVFRSGKPGDYQYFVLLGAAGEKINAEILDWVGEKVEIVAEVSQSGGWQICAVNPEDINPI
ncbi:hypothetical protein [Persicobacter diffluens]|uniref:Uncharacterized protein n=1 Tax=Persicobacter diffluens TaxID=981 RepID=A0AAN4VWT5_9BACT|nr:hypothetical protein PEDI_09140 [Persicobacter diffluens]